MPAIISLTTSPDSVRTALGLESRYSSMNCCPLFFSLSPARPDLEDSSSFSDGPYCVNRAFSSAILFRIESENP